MRLRIFTEPQQGATYDDLLAVARTADELGFDAFFRSDHYLRMGDGDAGPGPTDAWITLAGLARETSRLRLGTLVTASTFRLPGPLATVNEIVPPAATVDAPAVRVGPVIVTGPLVASLVIPLFAKSRALHVGPDVGAVNVTVAPVTPEPGAVCALFARYFQFVP